MECDEWLRWLVRSGDRNILVLKSETLDNGQQVISAPLCCAQSPKTRQNERAISLKAKPVAERSATEPKPRSRARPNPPL
jgi:hypothetical protein